MAVRGSIDDYSGPKSYFSESAATFFKTVLRLDPDHVSLQFEAWVTAGLDNREHLVFRFELLLLTACLQMLRLLNSNLLQWRRRREHESSLL